MNAAEHVVESYFRLCRGCLTFSDRKVLGGVNRQLDILACNLKENVQYHVEISVTHRLNWCPTPEELRLEFERKFFGVPPERRSKTGIGTDSERGKSYFSEIEATYRGMGFSPPDVKRVWVCWVVKGDEECKSRTVQFESQRLNRTFEIEVLSLRNCVLPELQEATKTANYDDEVLRVLGFIKVREQQMGAIAKAPGRNGTASQPSVEVVVG